MLLSNILDIVGILSALTAVGMYIHVVKKDKNKDWEKKADKEYVDKQDRALHYRVSEIKEKQDKTDDRMNNLVQDMYNRIVDIHNKMHTK